MRQTVTGLLEFIGGPFDGFREEIGCNSEELPRCVALPLDRQSARMFGLSGVGFESGNTAIYRLDQRNGSARYHFHSLRSNAGTPRSGGTPTW